MKLLDKVITEGGRRKYYFLGIKVISLPGRSMEPCIRSTHRTKQTVLVIRRDDMGCGLFAHFASNLGWIRWALENGMMPYVDMQTAPNAINRGQKIDFNPWECFFRQCLSYSPVEAMVASRVCITVPETTPISPGTNPSYLREGHPELVAWRKLVQEQIRISDTISAEVERVFSQDFYDGNVLGCLVRGTDYVKMKPKWHQVQPTPEQVVADAQDICRKRGFSRVFLATEDPDVEKLFRKAFGDRLLRYQTCMPEYKEGFLVSSGAVGDGARVLEMSRQYMVSVMLLSKCRGLLAGCASGSAAAMLFSPGYEWAKIYDLGVYQ